MARENEPRPWGVDEDGFLSPLFALAFVASMFAGFVIPAALFGDAAAVVIPLVCGGSLVLFLDRCAAARRYRDDPVPLPVAAPVPAEPSRDPAAVAAPVQPEPSPDQATRFRSSGRVTVQLDEDQLCPYCHVDLDRNEHLISCAACKTVLHRECLEEAGSCPTIGCRNHRRSGQGS